MTLIYTAKDAEALATRLKADGTSRAGIVQELSACCMGWPYVFAAAGEDCTPEWRRNRARHSNEKYAKAIVDNCPVLSGKQAACAGCKWAGVLCFDCRGFTRWLLLQVGIYIYGETVTTQWETASNWAAKGTSIQTMPHGLVCCVFRPSHTGMYLGNGSVRHCGGRKGQVVEEALPGNPKWERWGIPAGLYTTEELRKAGISVDETRNTPTLRKGSGGDNVEELQAVLNAKYGAALEVDGIFGAKTEQAVKAFQSAKGLTADGVVGPKTWAALGVMPTEKPGTPQPIDRYRYTWDTLLAAIKNPYGVAGLMGNLQAESGINPENLQNTGERALGMTDQQYTEAVDIGEYTAEQFTNDGYGYGLAQWTYRTRKAALLKYAKERGKSIGNLDMQLDFLMDELLGSYSSVWYALSNATTVREASDAVLLKYERPKNTSEENQQRRAEIGQEFFDRFADVDSEPETTPGETIAVDRTTLKALYAQAMAMAGTLKKIIEGE